METVVSTQVIDGNGEFEGEKGRGLEQVVEQDLILSEAGQGASQ